MRWVFLFFLFPLFGAYIGNPADPVIMNRGFFSDCFPFFKVTSGYIYDYTENKHYTTQEQQIKKFGTHSQMASLSFILLERFEVYGTAGGVKEVVKEKALSNLMLDIQTNYHFAWNVGARMILLKLAQTYLGLDVQYYSVPASHNSFFRYLNRTGLPIETEKMKFSIEEWQASGAIGSHFYFFTPYIGANYLNSKLHANFTYKNERNWGYFYGITLSLTGRLHFNFEKREETESSYSLKTTLVF